MNKILKVSAEKLRFSITYHPLKRRVRLQNIAIQIQDFDTQRGRFKDRPEAFLADIKGLFCKLPFRDLSSQRVKQAAVFDSQDNAIRYIQEERLVFYIVGPVSLMPKKINRAQDAASADQGNDQNTLNANLTHIACERQL